MIPEVLRPRKLPTPFGPITTPGIGKPKPGLPELDERRKKAVRHAVATDLTGILGLIPYVGPLIGGQIADLHFAEMKKILTSRELDRFIEADKKIPSNGLALLYSFVRNGER